MGRGIQILRWVRGLLEYVLVPVGLMVVLLMAGVLLAASPVVWEQFYKAPAGLGETAEHDGNLIAENLWSERGFEEVSAELKGGRMNAREVRHYEDLQGKFSLMLEIVLVSGPLVIWGLVWLRRRRAIWVSLLWMVGLGVGMGVWASNNFRHFFRTLHWWLFQDDSWRLPMDSYSLRLYPYSVWQQVIVLVGLFVVFGYLVILGVSFLAGGRRRRDAQ